MSRSSLTGMQRLEFTDKLIEKGKRDSTDALLKKLKVSRTAFLEMLCDLGDDLTTSDPILIENRASTRSYQSWSKI
jgi:hypothetical protein